MSSVAFKKKYTESEKGQIGFQHKFKGVSDCCKVGRDIDAEVPSSFRKRG